ncbi:MAG: tRNA lysidine(34) synthetase TilS [Candidatus Babeliaceae bacterium]|nr:tRNA lysidine(34) synthetase TilS [Candidatus Babeliaceae bacterium]
MEILQQLIEHVEVFSQKENLFNLGDTIVIGVSGGPDSLFLLHVLATIKLKYRLNLIVAHLDHGWRPESAQEVLFCRENASRYNVPFVTGHAQEYSGQVKNIGSKEAEGRAIRRLFFEKVKKEFNADKIALGHHRDDQIETFFIRLFRGSGLPGLCGMQPKDGDYIRPLLICKKEEIVEILNKLKIPFLKDPTNIDRRFLRNCIRLDILPTCRTCDERFEQSLLSTMARLREVESYIEDKVEERASEILKTKNGTPILNLKKWFGEHPFMQKALLARWLIDNKIQFTLSTAFLDEIVRFIHNQKSRSHQLGKTWVLEKMNGELRLSHIT